MLNSTGWSPLPYNGMGIFCVKKYEAAFWNHYYAYTSNKKEGGADGGLVDVYHLLTMNRSFNLRDIDTAAVTIGNIAQSKIVTKHEQIFSRNFNADCSINSK